MSKVKLAEAIKALTYDEMMDLAGFIYTGCVMESYTLSGSDNSVEPSEIAEQISLFATEIIGDGEG
jgi:hypothetical protein